MPCMVHIVVAQRRISRQLTGQDRPRPSFCEVLAPQDHLDYAWLAMFHIQVIRCFAMRDSYVVFGAYLQIGR